MVPAWQFTYWQWLSLTLAAPGRGVGRAGRSTGPPGSTSSTAPPRWTRWSRSGTLAALGWSLYALFWGTAGMPGHDARVRADRRAHATASGNIYLEAAAGVTTFILAGRYFEARSKRRAGAALRALLELGAKDVAVLRDGPDGPDEVRIPTEQLAVGDRFVVRPGREDRHRRRRRGGQLGRRRLDAHRRVGAGRGRPRATPSSAPPSTPADGSSSAPPASAPTPSWRRWPDWSRTPRTARPRCSGSPTGSPASSCRS